MTPDNTKLTAYHLVEELRQTRGGRSADQLAVQLRVPTVGRALDWLLSLPAPIENVQLKDRRCRRWQLMDSEYRIPYAQLPAQCRLWEIERAVAPGAQSSVLDSVLRLQRDNRMMRELLMRKTA